MIDAGRNHGLYTLRYALNTMSWNEINHKYALYKSYIIHHSNSDYIGLTLHGHLMP